MSQRQARDPNTAPLDLWGLALRWPEAVLGNSALPLIALENPALFQQIVFRAQAVLEARRLQAVVNQRSSEECWAVLRELFQAEAPKLDHPVVRDIVENEVVWLLGYASQGEGHIDRGRVLHARGRANTVLHSKLKTWDSEALIGAIAALDDLLHPDLGTRTQEALLRLRVAEKARAYVAGQPTDEADLAAIRAQLVAFGETP